MEGGKFYFTLHKWGGGSFYIVIFLVKYISYFLCKKWRREGGIFNFYYFGEGQFLYCDLLEIILVISLIKKMGGGAYLFHF